MGCAKHGRRLIVNADDFGASATINQAVIRAHQEGILTTASLMVNGDAAQAAASLARENPQLGVGLHLTLVCGRSTLPANDIPGLVDANQCFPADPVRAGMNYFFRSTLREQLEREIAAQLEKFEKTGLRLDHVNGHLNIHLHPTIFRLLLARARGGRIRALRLTHDPLWLNAMIGCPGRWTYRLSHALIYGVLCRWAKPHLKRASIRHTPRVFGLLETGSFNEQYLLRLLSALPAGEAELYCHPCVQKFPAEFEALTSPRARHLATQRGIQLIRYQDL
jgi:hopanoid biosynthesis associated protein HpnK